MRLFIQLHLDLHSMQIKVTDKTARGTKVIVATRSVKHVMVKTEKVHVQVKVFTFKKLGPNKKCERIVVFIKHGVEIIPADASVS